MLLKALDSNLGFIVFWSEKNWDEGKNMEGARWG